MEFWVVPNTAGLPTVDAAAIVAAGGGGGNGFAGQGAGIRNTGNQFIGTSIAPLIFNTEDYDDLGFADLGANNDRFIIPVTDPQITRVRLSVFTRWNNTAGTQSGIRQVNISKNGSSSVNEEGNSIRRERPPDQGSFDALYTFTSQPFRVIAGDFFQVLALQSSTSGTLGMLNCGFSIAVLR